MKRSIIFTICGALLIGTMIAPTAKADDDDDYTMKQVLRAARCGDAELKAVLSRGISINATDDDGETALMEAADNRNAHAVRVLINNGANVNAVDEDGETALMIAADEGNVEAVRLLIAAGANINARDEDGETALDKAQDEDNYTIVKILREAGAR